MKKLLIPLMLLAVLSGRASSIDQLVGEKLRQQGISPSPQCSDARLVRRLYLVTSDRIPTPEQTRASLQRGDREALVDSLLASEGFVQKMTLKWGDLLRIKSEFPSTHWPNAVQAYNKWLTDRFRANTPYDVFVRELLLGTGSNFRVPQTNIYRTGSDRSPATQADNIALLFMGQRGAPSEWSSFFTQIKFKGTGEWKEEILCLDIDVPAPAVPVRLAEGVTVKLQEGTDYRKPFVEWLTSDANRQFARAMANRMWFWFMGRGIVEPCDDMSPENEPTNAPLLEYLTDRFIASGYDMRALAREILLSETFSRSTLSTQENRADSLWFSHYPLQRLSSEQLNDAICDITEVPDFYSSRAPEPFTNYPLGTRAIELGDGTVTTTQLELFGRPSRDLALESNRDNRLDSKQTIYLLNSTNVYDKLRTSPYLKSLAQRKLSAKQIVEEIYLRVLNRPVSEREREAVIRWAAGLSPQNRSRNMAESLIWALLNSNEFLFMN